MNALNFLKSLSIENKRTKFPSLPDFAICPPKYTDKTANGLTKCIIDWIELNGYQAERVSTKANEF